MRVAEVAKRTKAAAPGLFDGLYWLGTLVVAVVAGLATKEASESLLLAMLACGGATLNAFSLRVAIWVKMHGHG